MTAHHDLATHLLLHRQEVDHAIEAGRTMALLPARCNPVRTAIATGLRRVSVARPIDRLAAVLDCPLVAAAPA